MERPPTRQQKSAATRQRAVPGGVLCCATKTAGWRQAADGTTADAPAGSAATRQRAVPGGVLGCAVKTAGWRVAADKTGSGLVGLFGSKQFSSKIAIGEGLHVCSLLIVRRAAVSAFDVLIISNIVPLRFHQSHHLASMPGMNSVVTRRSREQHGWILLAVDNVVIRRKLLNKC